MPASAVLGRPAFRVPLTAVALGALSGLIALSYHALDGALRGDGLWSYMNLMGGAFVQGSAVSNRLSMATAAGAAAFTVTATALSAATLAVGWPLLRRPKLYRIVAVALSLMWYYFSFRFFWSSLNPALVLHQPFPGTLVGYGILGLCIGLLPKACE